MSFYSKWYCAMSGADVLARRPKVKACQHQVVIRNGLFEESNEQHIFSKVFCN